MTLCMCVVDWGSRAYENGFPLPPREVDMPLEGEEHVHPTIHRRFFWPSVRNAATDILCFGQVGVCVCRCVDTEWIISQPWSCSISVLTTVPHHNCHSNNNPSMSYIFDPHIYYIYYRQPFSPLYVDGGVHASGGLSYLLPNRGGI